MSAFRVTVLPPGGGGARNVNVEAPDGAAAQRMMQSQGKVLSVRRNWMALPGIQIRLSASDRAIFLQRLAAMLESRVGLAESLRLIQETFRGEIRRVAETMRRRIEGGDDLTTALEATGARAFPPAVVAIIRTGSKGGDAAHAIREAVRFERESARIRKESTRGLGSALMGFFTGVAVLLGTTQYVLPEMQGSQMVQHFDVGQPFWVSWITQGMTVIGVITGVFSFLALFLVWVLRPIIPGHVDRLIALIPGLRDIVLAQRNYITFFGLAILIRAGLQIRDALELARQSAPMGETRNDLKRAVENISNGRSWPMAMRTLHPTDRAALSTSQDQKQVAQAVEAVAIQYQELYQTRIEQVIPIAQIAAALFLMGSGVALFGAVIIPLLEMAQRAMGGV